MEKIDVKDNFENTAMSRIICLCTFYIRVVPIVIAVWAGFVVYALLYGYNKDGEYCRYTESSSHYHIILDGEPCLLQWKMLQDFLIFYVMGMIVFYCPVLCVRWFLKKRMGRVSA